MRTKTDPHKLKVLLALDELRFDHLKAQNIMNRVTHGLIGFDLFINMEPKGRYSKYLKDFHSLTADELRTVLKHESEVELTIEIIKDIQEKTADSRIDQLSAEQICETFNALMRVFLYFYYTLVLKLGTESVKPNWWEGIRK